MPKKLRKIQRIFILLQTLILVCSVGTAIFFMHANYAKKSFELWKENFNKTATLIVKQVRVKGELLFKEIDNYTIFIVNEKDGSYVVEREAKSDKGENLWKSYHKKLIYQMQKQKQGWIVYPQTGIRPTVGQHMIRYLYIEELGWIVAVESIIGVQADFLGVAFDKQIIIQFLFIFLIGLFFFRWLTNYNFGVMKKIIADSLESSFMNLSNEEIWGGKTKEQKIEEKVEHTAPLEEVEEMPDLTVGPVEVEPEFSMEVPVKEVLEEKEIEQKEKAALAENIEKEKKFNSKPVFEEQKIIKSSEVQPKTISPIFVEPIEQIKDNVLEDEEDVDDLKIDVQRIKSPVLKKMIKELREKE
ncbi:hypothetical protein MNBD_UNCLBAC01-736 [hydrothermal vent metagenome]|uniref:Uncharacterized protein n=1 Tax=hydrothermal vent metagenome TaxID=652676 RepID=A0A3B1DG79_9ZZZZ